MNFYASIALLADTAAVGDSSVWIAAGFVLLAVAVVLGVLELFVPTGGVLAVATASTPPVGTKSSNTPNTTATARSMNPAAIHTEESPLAVVSANRAMDA